MPATERITKGKPIAVQERRNLQEITTMIIISKVLEALSILRDIESFDVVRDTLEKDMVFRGSRLWLLIFAILLASIGLNTNSTAVIIGAMLISPLMGPINGMGYSIATYDFKLLRKAFKNYSFAVLASLTASTLYFAVSPLSIAHSELLARTSPTIYDLLVALFGGLAGTISLTTRLKGNVVPGVAIATALMPPLCTAGYGLASGNFGFFFGALYLFTINTVFIGLSTVAFSQVIKFPIVSTISQEAKAEVNKWITIVTVATLVPSIYFGYLLVQKERFIENASKFVRSVGLLQGEYLLRYDIDADQKAITLVYGGRTLTKKDIAILKARAAEFDLSKAELKFEQGFSYTDFSTQLGETETMKSQISRLSLALQQNAALQDSLLKRSHTGKLLLSELRPLFPKVQSCFFAEPYRFSVQDSLMRPQKLAYVLVAASPALDRKEKEQISQWLRIRMQNDTLRVAFE